MFATLRASRDLIRVRKIFGSAQIQKLSVFESIVSLLPESTTNWFEEAGIKQKEQSEWIRIVGIQVAVVLLFGLIAGFLRGFFLATIFILFNFIILKGKSFKRTLRFEKDYPAFLLSLRSSVRTGHDPLVAFENTKEFFASDSPLRIEIERVSEALQRGVDEDLAIGTFAKSIKHPDVALFRTGFLLSRQHGSSLAPCLERLVRTTRQRQSFRRKISSAVAMQKLSSFGVAGCALFVPMMQFITNPDDLVSAMNHPMGGAMLSVGAMCVGGGLIWMLCMTRQKL